MTLLRVLKFIWNHPLNKGAKLDAMGRFVKWQFNVRLNPFPILYSITNHAKMFVWKGLTGATGNLYCGLMEYEDMGFLLHYLKLEDLFVDIGANVGVYTVLASAEIKAKTIAVEPIPKTYGRLKDNILINGISERVEALNIGLGREEGTIKFTRSLDTVNHVAIEGEEDVIDVPVKTLDDIIDETPNFLKIDVEGFETEVLHGGSRVLSSPELNALIIELNGSGSRYGFDEDVIHKSLLRYGFKPFAYNPITKKLLELSTYQKSHNTIYIKDVNEAMKRIDMAPLIELGNGAII